MKKVKRVIVFLILSMVISIIPANFVKASDPIIRPKPEGPLRVYVSFNGDGKLLVVWPEVENTSGYYQVDRRESEDGNNFGKWGNRKKTYSTRLEDVDLEIGKSYQYRVRVKEKNGDRWGNYTQSEVFLYQVPDSISEVKAELNNNAIKVTWESAERVDQYYVFRKEFSDKWSDWVLLAQTGSTEYEDKDVKSGNIYIYGVQPYNCLGTSATITNSEGVKVPLQIPAAPSKVNAVLENYEVKVTWSSVLTAEEYLIYRSEYNGTSWDKWVKIGKSASTEYIDNTVKIEKTYKYKVRASNSAGPGDGKNSAKIVIPHLTPDKPSDITVNLDNEDGVILSWSEVENAEGYIIYRQTAGINSSDYAIRAKYKDVNSAGFTDNNVQYGCKYKYSICAYNKLGNGEESDPFEVYICMLNITANLENGRVAVKWPEGGSAEKFKVYRRVYDGKGWSGWKYLNTTKDKVYYDEDLTEGYRYQYRIKAFYSSYGWGGEVNSTMVIAENLLPAAPEKLMAQQDNSEVRISWDEVENVLKYRIYRNEYNGTTWIGWNRIGETTDTCYKDTNIQYEKKYKYKVYSYNHRGLGKSNNDVEITTVLPKPASPQSVNVQAESKKVTVTWSKVENVDKYRVYRREFDGNEWSDWKSLTDTTLLSFTDINVIEGKEYIYSVKAYNKSGWGKLKKSAAVEIPLSKLEAPAEVTATIDDIDNTINISWSAVKGAKMYRVYRKEYDGTAWGSWTKLTDTASLHYSDTNVKAGVKYKYGVKGFYNDIFGAKKDSEKVMIMPQKPVAPANVTAKLENNVMIITWSAVEGATKYRVYRKEYDGTAWGSWEKLADTTELRYTDSTIETGKQYKYSVKAYNIAGWGVKAETLIVNTPIAVPGTPTNVQATEEDYRVVISWGISEGADSYYLYRRELNESNWGEWTEILNTNLLSYTDSDIRYGNKYQYAVRALNEGGLSEWGYSMPIKPIGPQFSYPKDMNVRYNGGYHKVTWKHEEGEPVYYFKYRTSKSLTEEFSEWSETFPKTTDFDIYLDESAELVNFEIMVFDSVTNRYYLVMSMTSVTGLK